MNETLFLWDFPGGTAGLCAAGALLLTLCVVSAWTTRRPVALPVRILMVLTRLAAFGLLLYCLCAPRLETKRRIRESSRYRLAVVTDESGSMRKPGFWKRSRLQDAERYIAENLKPEGRFEVEQFRFSDFFHPLSRRAEPGTRTDFLGMLVSRIPELESRGFNGVFWLTDGIDTVGRAETDAAFSALADSQMRHFFIPMTAPLEAPPSVALKKIEAPAQAYLNTEIPLTLLVRRVNISKKRNARLVLSRNGVTLGEFPIGPGTGVQTIQHRVAVRNIGTDRFTAELFLDGKRAETQSWTVAGVTRRNTRRILVYNGALEYGNRFLRNIFLNDPSVKLDIVFAPGVIQGRQAGEPVRLDDRLSLEKYDVLVLFNLNRKQITPEMERVLRSYAEDGGGLIFITGNPMVAAEFANSPLEKLLPVTFSEKYNEQKRYDARTAGIVRLITSGRRRPTDFDYALQRNSEMRYKEHPLRDFVLTQTGQASPIFRQRLADGGFTLVIPRFEDFAPVSKAKPAANVLARFRDESGTDHILMAYQNFGQGRSMILATDPLWRWKLKTGSDDPSFELFWKNLFSWLALGRTCDAEWRIPNRIMEVGDEAEFLFRPGSMLAQPAALDFRMKKENGVESVLVPSVEKKRMRFAVPLNEAGNYTLTALYDGKPVAAVDFTVTGRSGKRDEDSALEPDLALLERFASLSNVRLLSGTDAPDWDREFPAEHLELLEEATLPRWHSPWIYFAVAALILLEYFIRRVFGKLV